MADHVARLRRELADLGSMSAKTQRADGEILKAAHDRHAAVQARLGELRPKAVTDEAAGAEYQSLIEERGRLDLVIGGRDTAAD